MLIRKKELEFVFFITSIGLLFWLCPNTLIPPPANQSPCFSYFLERSIIIFLTF